MINIQTAMEKPCLSLQQLQREYLANIMLQELKPIQMPDGVKIQLCQNNMIEDGFCFFRCVAAQANLPNINNLDVLRLAACAFIQ